MEQQTRDEPFDDPVVVSDEPFDDDATEAALTSERAIAVVSNDLVSRARALTITDPASFELAGAFLDTLKTKKRQIEDFFKPDVERAYATWKGLTTKRASYVDPLDEAIDVLSIRYARFHKAEQAKAEHERRAREEEARQAEEARLRTEADAAAAEAQRLAQEAERAPTRDEAQVLEQQSAERAAAAEQLAIDSRTVQAPALPLQPSVSTPKHVSVTEKWEFEITSKMELIRAVAAGTVSSEALVENAVYLTKRAGADKLTVKIPGVRFFDAGKVTNRRRK